MSNCSQVEYTLNKGPVEKISLMIKAPITKGAMYEMQTKSKQSDPFEAEPRVYGQLLPRLRKKINCDFGPKSFPCPMRGMILQDLREDGFVVCDRLKQLDFSHSEMTLTLLAKFHAASVACYHDGPEFIRAIGKERVYHEKVDTLNFFCCTSLKNVGGMINEMEGCKQTADYISEKTETLFDSLMDLCKPREGSLNVLNHGDFWMTNVMFKHDDSGKAVEIKFIDFQVIRYASPVLDVLFFIYSSANPEAVSRQRDLLTRYLQTFNSSLESLGCEERMTPEQFDKEIKRCIDWALFSMCNILPIVLCDPDNVVDMETFSAEEFDKDTAFFKSKELQNNLPSVAKSFQDLFFSGKKVFNY